MNKKGVILMGGTGSRLEDLSKITNKHLLPVGSKPMGQWNVDAMVDAGIKDILIITGKEHMGHIVGYFGSGSEFGCNFTYKVQDEAGGIAEAVKLIDGFVEYGEKFLVALGDNIFEKGFKQILKTWDESQLLSVLAYKRVNNPERFGVLGRDMMSIQEKPKDPETNLAVVGVYGYTYDVGFFEVLNSLKYSNRGELEITDINDVFLSHNECALQEVEGDWSDAGTINSYKTVNSWDWVWE